MVIEQGLDDTRIVLTGVGGLSPVGEVAFSNENGPNAWDNIIEGADGITDVRYTAAKKLRLYRKLGVRVAAGLNIDLMQDPLVREHRRATNLMHRGAVMAWYGMYQAQNAAKIEKGQIDPYKIAAFIATVFGGADHLSEINYQKVFPSDPFKELSGRFALAGAMEEDFRGPAALVDTQCSGGAFAIDLGAHELLPHLWRNELMPARADLVIAGGADAPISGTNLTVFKALKGAVNLTKNPRGASRPFDSDAAGLVVGEGSAVFAMETWKKAMQRGLKPEDVAAELVAFDSLTHAESRTLAGMEGSVKIIKNILQMAKVAIGEKTFIHNHATSTGEGDPREIQAVLRAIIELGLDPADFYAVSTKGAVGHTMGATGALGLYFAIMAVRDGVVPPALNLHNPIRETQDIYEGDVRIMELQKKINLSPLRATKVSLDVAASFSFGFGGSATGLAVRKFRP